jgi:thiamine-phosphate pyrophosphorylase
MSSKFADALAGTHLYPITDRNLSGLSHAEQVFQLASAGAKVIQLRDKSISPLEFFEQAQAAMKVARDCGVKLIINDRVDIAKAIKADGVHIGQNDLPPNAARQLLGPDAIIGFSTHNLIQAQSATQFPVDYIAIGPVFSTSTKADPDKPVGLAQLRQVRNTIGSIPLVAIGGITLETYESVLIAGADAVAVIGDIWGASQPPSDQVRRFLRTNKLQP